MVDIVLALTLIKVQSMIYVPAAAIERTIIAAAIYTYVNKRTLNDENNSLG